MPSILKATSKDAALISNIASISFVESHGSSASTEDINAYKLEKYSEAAFKEELSNEQNIYHIIYADDVAAGYSKIIFDVPYSNAPTKNIAKLERIYLLKEFYSLKLGLKLFEYNMELAKSNHQKGIWLFVWKENERAVNFYTKAGFKIIGSHDFKISETHSNPNHQMLLEF